MASSAFGVTFSPTIAGSAFLFALLYGGGSVYAQGIGSPSSFSGLQGGTAPSFSKEQLDRSLRGQRKPPAALPGAAAKEAIAPPSKVPTLMSPTEQLFDAINRGDMANVRDALSRGADLSASNELGLTPLDLSIDLGRNSISFLLLSRRDATPARTGPAPSVNLANANQPPHGKAPRHAARERPTNGATRVAAAGQRSLPTLFANNGGAPIPH
ncbi:MAG: hypothetical protein ABI369_08665, partial [Acetobacteraceae bacterium]